MSSDVGRLPVGHQVAGRYQVARFLGAGEMGEVYDVRDITTGYAYALKLFIPEMATAREAWAALRRDAERAAQLDAEALAKAYEFAMEEQVGAPYVLGEYVTFPSLASLVETQGPLSLTELEGILRSVASALDVAHRAGLVHRALKPQNIFATPTAIKTWQVRVSDFGIGAARPLAPPPPGWTASPGWLSAEQADPASPPTPAMDVYTLALVAFYALTGRSPFVACRTDPPDLNILWAEMTAPLPPASQRARELGVSLSPTLDAWFARALAVSPNQRFQSAGEMVKELRNLVGSSQQLAAVRPPTPAAPPQPVAPEPSPMPAAPAPRPIPAAPAPRPLPAAPDPMPMPAAPDPMPMPAAPDAIPMPPALAAGPAQSPVAHGPKGTVMLQGHESPVDMRSAVADALLAPPVAAGVPQAQPIALEPTDFDAPKKRGRGMLLPIVLGGGLGLLAVGLAVWWLFDSGDTEPDAHAAAGADAAAASASATADTAPVLAATPDAAETAPPSPSAAEPEVEAPPTDALVKFACNPACDQIKCDGKKVAAPSEGIRLSPGRHTCVGSKAGYLPAKESFQVKAGEDLKRDLRLSKIRYAPPPPKPARTCGTFLNPCK